MRAAFAIMAWAVFAAACAGCEADNLDRRIGVRRDAGAADSGGVDAGAIDSGSVDASEPDASEPDASEPDASEPDASEPDAEDIDAGSLDAAPLDGGCFAIHFDGTLQNVRIANDDSLAISGPLTVEAWVRPNAAVVNPPWHPNIVSKRNTNGIYPAWGFGLSDGLAPYTVMSSSWFYASRSLVTDRWTHVAVVFDGAQLQIYVDGTLDSSTNTTQLGPPNADDIYLGTLPDDTQNYRGDIAGLRVSRVARYSAAFVPPPRFATDADTLIHLPMDEGMGLTANDVSGAGHHGTLQGATWIDGCP